MKNLLKAFLLFIALFLLTMIANAGYPVNTSNKGGHTAPKAVATVSTATATSTTKFTSILGGNVSSDGGLTVTERGVCWGTSLNPTIDKLSNRLANGSGTGSFSTTIAPLLPGVQYHVRAYAINSAGTAYGANVIFTTTAASANRGWYFSSSTGNDNTGNGTLATPYQTLIKLQSIITNGNVTFQPGDSVLFKKGDVFANGYTGTSGFEYVSCSWINDPRYGYTSPSGTAAKPIIITSYGVGAKPNFYFPTASSPIRGNSQIQHNIFEFAGVEYIIIDGLNFIDTRFPATNHSDPAYTRSAIIFGEWINGYNADPNVRRYVNNHCEVKNCRFENVSFGLGSVAGSYNKFTYDTMINMMACTDTFGTHDIGAGAFEGLNGYYNDFSHNYIESSWGKSGRNSSGQGMLGVAFDIFCLKNSRIAYNTIIDVRHAMEIGNLDTGDSTSGAQYDTFAFNKCVGMYQFGYLHGGADAFTGNVHNISIWNNVLIENQSSRMSGPNFGYDRKGNGTNFNQFWFFGNKNLTNGYNVGYGNFTNGSNIVTGMTETGGMVAGNQSTGSQVAGYDNNSYLPESPMAWITAKTGTATNATLTLSQPATATASQQEIIFFPPWNMKGITWSMPPNVSSSGYYNSWDNSNANNRLTVQYSSDNTVWGRGFDTLVDMRNNIFYNTTGMQMIPSGFNRFKHRNNAYYVKGGFSYTGASGVITNLTRMGGALGTNEVSTIAKLFVDTSAALPEYWNLTPMAGSPVAGTGIPIPVFTTDFAGATLTNPPSMGLYNYASNIPSCLFTYGAWNTCVNGLQSRSYSSSPAGCTGLPPADSISRVCSSPCASFTYTTWSTCSNNIQTRGYTGSPSGCVTTPPIDSVQRSCTTPCIFTYSAWSTCNGTTQTRTYYVSPFGCVGTPPLDSLTRSCSVCIPPATITYSVWSTCINNRQTRSYSKNPPDCPDLPPVDSIQRSCTALCTSFAYGSWSGCINGIQTRSYTATPSGCIGTPPIDSIQRTCSVGCVFSYGTWTTCSSGLQTRSYVASPAGCSGTPPTDSISRACSGTALYLTVTTNRQTSCNNKSTGYIIVKATGGVGPYYYSINSTTNYILNKTTFSGLGKATYTIRVRDSIGTIYTITVKVTSRSNRNC